MNIVKKDLRLDEGVENCEELWDINNGITLCLKCHKKYHSENGNSKEKL